MKARTHLTMHKIFLLALSVVFSSSVCAQDEIKKIIPASPTTASLGKYGEIPVNMSSGIPNISVPLYQVKGRDLNLPIELTYHASGIKVEEASSWVGLGWSLNAGGVITRQVRSLPDEEGGGAFSSSFNTNLETLMLTDETKMLMMSGLETNTVDFEPDLFFFNFSGRSGKFIYNKEQDKFETIPRSRMKITYKPYPDLAWEIITEDGTVYSFGEKELNSSGSFCMSSASSSPRVTTGWYLSNITSVHSSDYIDFEYETFIYQFNTLKAQMHSINFSGSCHFLNSNYPEQYNCTILNEYLTQRLKKISFNSGSVEFVKGASTRCDLNGDHALDSVKIFNNRNELITSYKLNYGYFGTGSSPCSTGVPAEDFRLKLISIDRLGFNNTGKESYRNFDYMTDIVPSRLSYDQDYWGYYNFDGSDVHNISLVPTTKVPELGPLYIYRSANRYPSKVLNTVQMGMLKRMTYPTGGYTEFEFENHTIPNSFAPEFVWAPPVFLGPSSGSGPIYQTTFTINYAPHPLNGDNGGAFIKVDLDGINCQLGTTNCGSVTLTGPTGANFTGDAKDYYLPNGTYTLRADFTDMDPSVYSEFFVSISWKELAPNALKNSAIGGLRVKRIFDYDPAQGKAIHQKYYKYYSETDQETSSAVTTGYTPNFKRHVTYISRCGPDVAADGSFLPPPETCERIELSAFSGYPGAGMGNGVSYSFVTVLDDADGNNGMTTYKFTSAVDVPNTNYPFAPAYDLSWSRGLLLEQKEYAKTSDPSVRTTLPGYVLTKQTTKSYKTINDLELFGIKAGKNVICCDGANTITLWGNYNFESYGIPTGFIYNDSTIVKTYPPGNSDAFVIVQKDTYSPVHYNVIKEEKSLSDGGKLITTFKYPEDYTQTDGAAIQFQKDKNITGNVIERLVSKEAAGGSTTLLGGDLSLFSVINGGKLVKSNELTLTSASAFTESTISNNQFQYSGNYASNMEVTKVSSTGLPLETIARNGDVDSFIWNESESRVMAVAKGALSSTIFYNGFENETQNISSDAKTGYNSYSASYTVTAPGTGNFVLTYWKKIGSGDWSLVQTTLSGSSVIGGQGILIDDVKIYPSVAQITTYTYAPGVGITSSTDPNNKITFFEYDSFGRLVKVSDDQKQILKTYTYHLKNQTQQ